MIVQHNGVHRIVVVKEDAVFLQIWKILAAKFLGRVRVAFIERKVVLPSFGEHVDSRVHPSWKFKIYEAKTDVIRTYAYGTYTLIQVMQIQISHIHQTLTSITY